MTIEIHLIPKDVARMWHENGTGVDTWLMDENTKPPSSWAQWQATPPKRKIPLYIIMILAVWVFPPIILVLGGIFIYQYSRRNK